MNQGIKTAAKKIMGEEPFSKLQLTRQLDRWEKANSLGIKEDLAGNIRFKDIHEGERCFILGNGPSLKEVDLSLLKDEAVFTVNNFCEVKDFEKVRPNYHLWLDGAFFGLRNDSSQDIDKILERYEKTAAADPECFVPADAKKFILENGLENKLRINYIFPGLPEAQTAGDIRTELTGAVNVYRTVVQYAVAVAIYMGFKEIILLGCDSTNILMHINTRLYGKSSELHAYEKGEGAQQAKQLTRSWKFSELLKDQYLLFREYENLAEYCSKKGIKLYNCSSQTLIDSIERKTLQEVLNV